MPPSGRGILVIVSSPSGAGKTTLARRLIAEFGWLEFSISYTTRPMRAGEQDGRDYHFVDADTFERWPSAASSPSTRSSTATATAPRARAIDAALAAGRDVLFDVDWQGGKALSRQWPDDCLKIFILPPDLATLEARLRARATDAPEVIERRLDGAFDELNHFHEYQFQIVNDDLDRAYEVLRAPLPPAPVRAPVRQRPRGRPVPARRPGGDRDGRDHGRPGVAREAPGRRSRVARVAPCHQQTRLTSPPPGARWRDGEPGGGGRAVSDRGGVCPHLPRRGHPAEPPESTPTPRRCQSPAQPAAAVMSPAPPPADTRSRGAPRPSI